MKKHFLSHIFFSVRRHLKFVVMFSTLYACIEPFNIVQNNYQKMMIVDGTITDQPGPYTVKLFMTKPLDASSQINTVDWVKGAQIVIYDDQGNQESLTEITDGNYLTSANGIQGVVGRTYHIAITTTDNKTYESLPEKILPVGDLTRLYFDFSKVEDPDQFDIAPTGYAAGCSQSAYFRLDSKNGFNVYLDAKVLPEQNGLVRWRWTGTYHVKTFPSLKTKPPPPPASGCIPYPVRCSGYIIDPENRNNKIQVGPCTCCDCWVSQYSATPLLSDKRPFINISEISRLPLTFLPATRRLFYEKYWIQVEQMSVSEEAYTFWNYVKQQEQLGSDLFQTPPPRLVGNIIETSVGGVGVLGLFGASAVTSKEIFINRSDIPYSMPPIDSVAESCSSVLAFPHSTNVKPAFW